MNEKLKITSKNNQYIVDAKKLLDKKTRRQSGLFLIETEKVIREAMSCNLTPKCFFVLEGKDFDFLKNVDAPVFELSKSVFAEISTLVTPDGIVAEFCQSKEKFEYVGGRFLILDGLQNPDNFGAIMRTALATGFENIYTINCVDKFNPKVIRSSMGNQFKLNICEIKVDDIKTLFAGAKIYTASMEGKNLFEMKSFEKNVGIVIGNEGNGVSQEVKNLVNDTISIPMQNNVESLNASVSASVIMYYIWQRDKIICQKKQSCSKI